MLKEILKKSELTRDDILFLLSLKNEEDIDMIFKKACEIRNKYLGEVIHLRGIIEISNFCEQNCIYCGLRKSNKSLDRYRMNINNILNITEMIYNSGIKTIVLQSGEDFNFSTTNIYDIIVAIKSKFDVAITLSLGEREFIEYKIWKEAGADRYLLKHETANPKLYSSYHSGQDLFERLAHLKYLKNSGYQIGSGNLIGLPLQRLEDIADDILLCKKLDVDMASFSPFISSPDTPYRGYANANLALTLKTIAVARIVLKNSHMPVTTALSALDIEGRKKGFMSGANVIMPNFTPKHLKEKYKIYPKLCNSLEVTLEEIEGLVKSLRLKIADGQGHSLKIASIN